MLIFFEQSQKAYCRRLLKLPENMNRLREYSVIFSEKKIILNCVLKVIPEILKENKKFW